MQNPVTSVWPRLEVELRRNRDRVGVTTIDGGGRRGAEGQESPAWALRRTASRTLVSLIVMVLNPGLASHRRGTAANGSPSLEEGRGARRNALGSKY